MYYPQEPKEPSGCFQTLIITRVILSILLIPLGTIFGAILIISFAFYALTIHPLLALIPIGLGVAIILALIRWESRRVARENPPADR
jgi:hypothetical protein